VSTERFKAHYLGLGIPLAAAISDVVYVPAEAKENYMHVKGFGVLDVVERATRSYNELKSGGRWIADTVIKDLTGAVDMNQAEVPTPSGSKSVEAMITDAVTGAVATAMSRFNPNCYNCDKPGHRAIDCPTKGAAKSGGASNPKSASAWRYIGPTNGITTVTKEGIPYHWCKKCLGGRGHWTTTHTGDAHRRGEGVKKGRSAPREANVGEIPNSDDPADDDDDSSQYGIMLPWGS
jgi:hypothetical protein